MADKRKDVPACRNAGDGDECGRDLTLVEEMTRRWGTDTLPQPWGKRVWAEVAPVAGWWRRWVNYRHIRPIRPLREFPPPSDEERQRRRNANIVRRYGVPLPKWPCGCGRKDDYLADKCAGCGRYRLHEPW